MLGMKTTAVVVPVSVIPDHVLHPFGVRLAHVLHIGVLMVPIARGSVVRFVLSVIGIAAQLTSVPVRLIIGGDPLRGRLERAVRTEIQPVEIAP